VASRILYNEVMTSPPIYRLNRPQLLLLRAIHDYDYLTSDRACRLLFSGASKTYAQANLKRLADADYLVRIELPRRQRVGSGPIVYAVSSKGRRLLAQLGVEVSPYRRPSEEREHTHLFLEHTLDTVDVLIAATLLGRHEPRVELVGFRGERALKRTPVPTWRADGSRINVAPDSWMDVRSDGKWQDCLVLELDRNTEFQQDWRRKIAALVAYAAGPYQEAFGTTAIHVIVVVTVGGERRVRQLLDWTARELAHPGREGDAELFSFTGADPTGDPVAFFLGDHW